MNKVIRLGMLFNEGNVPDFGSIQMKSNDTNTYYLLAQDIPKLNGMLTKAAARSYLPEGESFNFPTGTLAFVVDHKTAGSAKIYSYHRKNDRWYEFNIRSDLEPFKLMCNRHERILKETKEISGTPPLTFESNGRPLKNYRIYGNTINGESVGDLVTEGEHAGEYCIPLKINNTAINLYLNSPLRKVGTETDYVDFMKRIEHKVRKNLFNIDIANNSYIHWDGSLRPADKYNMTSDYIFVKEGGKYTYSCFPTSNFDTWTGYCFYSETDETATIGARVTNNNTSFTFTVPVGANYIRIGSRYLQNGGKAQLEEGESSTEYVPYIANTEINITLPDFQIPKGTNTIYVETHIQPSKVELRGSIENIT